MKIIAVTKSAPFWNSDLAIAVRAYEHDDGHHPEPTGTCDRTAGRWSPITRSIWSRGANACTAPERVKPRIRGQSVSQNMKKPSRRLAQRLSSTMSRPVAARRSRLHETGNRRRRLGDLGVGLGATAIDCLPHTGPQMRVEQLQRDAL